MERGVRVRDKRGTGIRDRKKRGEGYGNNLVLDIEPRGADLNNRVSDRGIQIIKRRVGRVYVTRKSENDSINSIHNLAASRLWQGVWKRKGKIMSDGKSIMSNGTSIMCDSKSVMSDAKKVMSGGTSMSDAVMKNFEFWIEQRVRE